MVAATNHDPGQARGRTVPERKRAGRHLPSSPFLRAEKDIDPDKSD